MKISGNRQVKASPEYVWDLLMDPEILARITPGITSLEPTGKDEFKAIADIKIGPVKGSFQGEMKLEEKSKPNHFTLHVNQKSKVGNVDSTVQVTLEPLNSGSTKIQFEGKANLSGFIARIGQRMLTGVSNSLTNQFFDNLENEIESSSIKTQS